MKINLFMIFVSGFLFGACICDMFIKIEYYHYIFILSSIIIVVNKSKKIIWNYNIAIKDKKIYKALLRKVVKSY